MVIQNVDKAQIKLKMRKDNVAGVSLPIFETYIDGGDSESTHSPPICRRIAGLDPALIFFAGYY